MFLLHLPFPWRSQENLEKQSASLCSTKVMARLGLLKCGAEHKRVNKAVFSYLLMSSWVRPLSPDNPAQASPEGTSTSHLNWEEPLFHRRNQVEGIVHHPCQSAKFLSQRNQEAHKKTLSLGHPCLPSFHPPGAWERATKGCGEQ